MRESRLSEAAGLASDLPPHLGGLVRVMGSSEPLGDARTLQEVERRHILHVWEDTRGNHARAAQILGLDRRTLYRKLCKYKLQAAGK